MKRCLDQRMHSHAFSLIEMLVALSIAALLLAIGAPSLHALTAQQQMRTAVNDLFAAIGLTRSLAITRGATALLAPLDPAGLERRLTTEDRLVREQSGRMVVRRIRRVGAIVFDEKITGAPDRATITKALRDEVEADGLGGLKWGERANAVRARLAFLHGLDAEWPEVSDAALLAAREDWLWPLLEGVQALSQIRDEALAQGLETLVPWDRRGAMDELAPARLTTPLGSAGIDYGAEGGPRVEIRVQELFGVTTHPAVGGGRGPLTLALLSPARRPIQMTKDLPGFWRGSWKDVRSEMRGRYPRHPWPENPAEAPPTNRVKPRGT